jgi:hypothetical protein
VVGPGSFPPEVVTAVKSLACEVPSRLGVPIQHRLARTGRPDHEEMVRSRGCDLERAPAESLTAHIGEVGYQTGVVLDRGRRWRRPCGLTPEYSGQRLHAVGLLAAHERRLAQVAQRDDEPGRHRGVGQGDHARDVTQRTVEAQLAAERQPFGAGGTDLAGGDEKASSDREVETGAPFADARRSQVDGDPTEGPGQSAREDGGAYAIACLADGRVGQTDNGEPRQPVRHVDLDRDGATHGTVERGGRDGGKHEDERSGSMPGLRLR